MLRKHRSVVRYDLEKAERKVSDAEHAVRKAQGKYLGAMERVRLADCGSDEKVRKKAREKAAKAERKLADAKDELEAAKREVRILRRVYEIVRGEGW